MPLVYEITAAYGFFFICVTLKRHVKVVTNSSNSADDSINWDGLNFTKTLYNGIVHGIFFKCFFLCITISNKTVSLRISIDL